MAADSARRPRLLLVGALVAAVVVVLVGAMLLGPKPSPSPSTGPTSPPAAVLPPISPVIVTIDSDSPGIAHAGYGVEIRAAALGTSGVAGIELWAGGERVGYAPNTAAGRPAASAHWQWTPTAAGEAVLVARAFDSVGHVSQSSPLRLTVVADPQRSYALIEVTSNAGETAEAVVLRAGGDPGEAIYWNPDLPPGPLPAGTVVTVPKPDAVVPPPVADASTSGDDAAVIGLADAALAADVGPVVPVGLASPELHVTVADCTISTQASGGTATTEGFAFNVLPPSADSFVALPPVESSIKGTATMSFGALAGVNFVSVSAYDEQAVAPSAIVPVAVPPECGTGGWEGNARLEGGKLVVPGTADRAYLYLKVGDGTWGRVPSAAGEFVNAANGGFDFSDVLPSLVGKDLQLEAWGWAAGSLVKLGAGTYDAPGDVLYSGAFNFDTNNLGVGTSLDIVLHTASTETDELLTRHSAVDRPGQFSQSSNKAFKWQTTVSGVTHLQWQILPYALFNSISPTPPFLIDTGTIGVQGLTTGYFHIDLKPYLTGQATGVTSAFAWMQQQVIGNLVQANPYVPGATAAPADFIVNPNGIWLPGATPKPTAGPGGVTIGQVEMDNLAFLLPPPTAFYIRIIPFKGLTPVGNPSNTVVFDVVEPDDPHYIDTSPPPPPPQYTDAHNAIVKFFPPTGSQLAYMYCVKVVKNGFTSVIGDWSNGTTHCRPKKDDSWSPLEAFESFVEWVGSVWDYVSTGYDWIQDKVVDAVLAVVPCAQLADKVTDDGEGVCRTLAKTALQAVAMAYGIPPEIPSWEATISAYKGDLREFILKNAKSLPGVSAACDAATIANKASSSAPTCEQAIQKAVDSAIGQLVSERSKAAASFAGVVVPSGVIVEPHPKGFPQPPHFDVTVIRTNAQLPVGIACSLYGRMTSTVENWSWLEYEWHDGQESVVTKKGTVSGEPFYPHSQDIAPLAPGESATYQVWLSQRQIWFEPDGWDDHYAQEYAEWHGQFNHGWVLLQKGAVVEGKLVSSCAPTIVAKLVLSGQASD